MTALLCAYAAVAYWLFWRSLDVRDHETGMLIVGRAVLYLVAGPALLAALWVAAYAVAILHEYPRLWPRNRWAAVRAVGDRR